MHSSLQDVDALVCDLDGVVYRGNDALPGAVEAIARLQAGGLEILFCTNNSRATVAQYVDKLASFGIEVERRLILTSAVVLQEVLQARSPRLQRAIVIGGDGVREAIEGAGLELSDGDTADVVAVGWDPTFTYDDLRRASFALHGGAELIATNADATFPAEGGRLLPGAGPIVAAIEVAGGVKAEVVGKPQRPMMEAARARLQPARRIAAVGDRPETDLDGGRAMGWKTILVLSGVTSGEQAGELEEPPDVVVESLAALAGS
jgi:HAD superfamily hydrolase (TIGR01450 family)